MAALQAALKNPPINTKNQAVKVKQRLLTHGLLLKILSCATSCTLRRPEKQNFGYLLMSNISDHKCFNLVQNTVAQYQVL